MNRLESRASGWETTRAFLAARAIAGIEVVGPEAYHRAIVVNDKAALLTVRPDGNGLSWETAPELGEDEEIRSRLARLFGLDHETEAAREALSADPDLGPLVTRDPHLRIPGCWETFELAVRAVLGQQVSVAGARTMAGRLVAATGRTLAAELPEPPEGPTIWAAFPTPVAVAEGDLSTIGLTRQRERTLRSVAAAFAEDPALLRRDADIDTLVARLTKLPGIGPWTAHYMALRGARHPDAFPSSDLGLLRAMANDGARPSPKALEARAEAWRPYRTHAAQYLWTKDAE